jgi:tetratricopeptide (TPR) repeat protein
MTNGTLSIAALSGTIDPSATPARQATGPSASLPSGSIINGRYELRRLIGAGGMGSVYEVGDALHPERKVALKTIHGAVLRPERVSLFKSEFKTMAELRHPNVAAVYDFEPLQGSTDHFFTMEHIAGRDLLQASEGVSCSEIVAVLVQICRALSYLHSRKIVHFDIKPANILVDGEKRVRVLDFGIAGNGRGNMLLGTPAYMAPELLSDEADVDHRADLYSLGVVLYQLLARRVPFTGATVAILLQKHATEPVAFDDDTAARWPEWLRHITLRLCAKEPAERYRSANAVIEDINRLSGSGHQLETAETKESYILSSRFVGRERELERVLSYVWGKTGALTDASAGAMVLSGVSGVGKSRFVREVKQQAQLAGLPFVEGSCYEGAFDPLGPFADVHRHVARLARSSPASDLLERYSLALGSVDPTLVPGVRTRPFTTEDERRMLIEQLGSFLIEVAERVPYVLYLNDLQWASGDTIDLARNLVKRLARQQGTRAKLALLGSYRADELQGRPLARLLSESDIETIALKPLEGDQIQRMLGSMLGIDELPRAFVDRVTVETAGVPFFVEEVMRSLVDRGDVYLEQGRWAASAAVGELEIPATMANVFRRRASLLEPRARALFEVMAVYAQPVPARTLAAVMGADDETIFRLLRGLFDRQMAVPSGGDELVYSIHHDRMRQILYADLTADRRRQLHHDIARTLAELNGDVHAIAHHYWLAEAREPALFYLLRAGDEAQKGNAYALAIEHLGRALGLMDEASRNGEAGLQITERLGDLEVVMGDYTSALNRYRSVLEVMRAPLDRARLLRKIGRQRLETGEFAQANDSLQQAIQTLTGQRPMLGLPGTLLALIEHLRHRLFGWSLERDPVKREALLERGRCYSLLGHVFFFLDVSRVPAATLRACSALERGGDSSDLCKSYGLLAFFYSFFDLGASAASFGDRGEAMAERLGTPLDIAGSALWRGAIHLYRGDLARAMPLLDECKALLLKHGDLYTLSMAEILLNYLRLVGGRPREAAESADKLLPIFERAGSHALGKDISAQAAYLRRLMGERECESDFQRAYEAALAANDTTSLITILSGRGHLEWAQGRIDEALATTAEARRLIEKSNPRHVLMPFVYSTSAHATMEREDRPSARTWRLIRRILRYTKRWQLHRALALTAHAVYEWKRGHHARANQLFDEAMASATQQGSLLALNEARLLKAKLTGDPARLEEAYSELRRHEMLAYLPPHLRHPPAS